MRATFTKAANGLDVLIVSQSHEVQQIQVNSEILQKKCESLEVVEGEICEELLEEDVSEENIISEIDSCHAYERRFTMLKLKCNSLTHNEEVQSERQSLNPSHMITSNRK